MYLAPTMEHQMWMKIFPNIPKYPFICPYAFLSIFSRENIIYHYYTYRLFHQSTESRFADLFCTLMVFICLLKLSGYPSIVAWFVGLYNIAVALYIGDIALAITSFILIQLAEMGSRYVKRAWRVLGYTLLTYACLYLYYEHDTLAHVTRLSVEEIPFLIVSGIISQICAVPRLLTQVSISLLEYDGSIRYPAWQAYVDRAYNSGRPALDFIGESFY